MAARYVNPQNVVAQGQGFYTGLSDRDQAKDMRHAVGGSLTEGSYSGHGGGGGTNVMGRGSGGSAGVSADRTGSDSSKSWNYKPSLNIAIDVQDRREEQEKEKEKPVGELGPGGPGGPVNPKPWAGPRQPRPMGELNPGPMGELNPGPMGELNPGPMGELNPGPMGELNPGPQKPSGPSQTPGAIRKRAARAKARDEREANAAFQGAINPAIGGLFRTPHRNLSGPISSGPPQLGTPIEGVSGSRTNGRPA